ncbi:DUF262 domain-containing protein [Alishewanella sp. SMS8]|uniref:DUF262 domain-containing protein n=1 Tax=Alishewanella sp. SMS8 TaxID=2994676 RepID=UPI002740AC68|nr:DUF262 domain-containing protein [Alishewanella sp. SMS8]MDP5459603.1 DUF262 domain-containing protein [Alishewanella sp. SMS8]
MSSILTRESNTITVANFWENYLLEKYNFDPAYQRKSVWSDEKQSFFIDSILKNFPMPPIFLHQKIDDATGKTKYDIIDGKQRLISLVRFLNNEIPASDEFENSPFYDENIAGIYFSGLDEKGLTEYKKKFWRYVIPIEYIDTSDRIVIDNIFDRLNRNGEPLNGQELRKSIYHGTDLLLLVERIADAPNWKDWLKKTDVARMEHYEFVSEILFQLIENNPLHANQQELDRLYEKYSRESIDWGELESKFENVTRYIASLELDFESYRIGGVSHLYGIWCFANKCVNENIPVDSIKQRLIAFYDELRSNDTRDSNVDMYKKSMSSRTKDQGQRKRRFQALCNYVISSS